MPKDKSFLSESELTPSGKSKRHLFIVITDPDADNNQVVVSVTTHKFSCQDCSCKLSSDDHEFIKHESVIDFKRTRVMNYLQIFNGIHKGLLIDKGQISEKLLKRIQNAAISSKFIPQNIKQMFNNF